MTRVIVRYRVRPEHTEENLRLVEAVYEELAGPAAQAAAEIDLRYATFLDEDGVSFTHVAEYADGAVGPGVVPAFATFRSGLEQRLDGPLERREVRLVGRHAP